MFLESREIREKFNQSVLCAYELQMDPEHEVDREPMEKSRDMEQEEEDEPEMGT